MIRTLVADCPWRYKDELRMSKTKRSAAAQYPTMTVEEIERFIFTATHDNAPLYTQLAWDAFLWLWITNPLLLDGTGARVCRAWGFKPKQLITWVKGHIELPNSGGWDIDVPRLKTQLGMGHYTRGVTEHMILATKGSPKCFVKDQGVPNYILAEELEETLVLADRGAHSVKPEASYQLIERVTPGPYVELFARRRRQGWTCYGNQLE